MNSQQQAQRLHPPSLDELKQLFIAKYGDPDSTGPGPAQRYRFNYYNPDEYYEALLDRLVTPGCSWLDVGCGRDIFPSNPSLAQRLADRAGQLVGIDPDETLQENPFVHEKVQGLLDDYRPDSKFDLITLRMVAEHVENPARLIEALNFCAHSGSIVVIYTVFKYSPIPLLTNLVPFTMRHPIKKWLWSTEEKDTFPTCFLMNTRRTLDQLFNNGGFTEELFLRLDDCRTSNKFAALQRIELVLWSLFNTLKLHYPEHCILGVYRKI